MRQQINLYQTAAAVVRPALSASTVGRAAVFTVLTLASIWGYGSWEVTRLGRGVDGVRHQQERQQTMVTDLGGASPQPTTLSQLDGRIQKLNADIAVRSRAVAALRSGAAGQTTGFAFRMEALARRHIEGLWLDRLVLGGGAGIVLLAGTTLDPDLVPRYLQNLAADPALKGMRFDDFIIERPESAEQKTASAPGLRFRAANSALDAPVPAGPS